MARLFSGLLALGLIAVPAAARAQSAVRITVTASPGGSLQGGGPVGDAAIDTEIDEAMVSGDADNGDGGDDDEGNPVVNRTIVHGRGSAGVKATGRSQAKSNPELVMHFEGLNFHDQRFANGGNQFSVEPPDQGLCAGNGYVLETVNDVLRIFDSSGNAVTPAVDLNTFYGYPAAINRTTGADGPSITDPSCYFDPDTQRWFHVVLTLDRVGTTAALAGPNHFDIAVSTSANPTGGWIVYRIPTQNDGTQGTPDHGCQRRVNGVLVHGACLSDYPHIGADANGFYITSNEFNLFAPSSFHEALVYAFDKHAMAANATTVSGVLFRTDDPALLLDGADPGFTVWPATSPAGIYNTDNGGTEFLVSSDAVFSNTRTETRLRVWSVTNTQSLATGVGLPALSVRVANVISYGIPSRSFQKPGSIPLQECVADTTILPTTNTKCIQLVGAASNFVNSPARLDSNDSRMQQVIYANGKLWAALDTGLLINGTDQENGIAYFVLNPNSLNVFAQGYIGLANNNVNYPAIAVTPSGRGVIAFTLVGADHYPTAAYASLDAKVGAGDIHVVTEGAGPQDGFTGYFPLVNPIRPRWGDYGGAVADGNTIWIASEAIAQTCSYTDYKVGTSALVPNGFGTCGGTRSALGNWSTRISKLRLGP